MSGTTLVPGIHADGYSSYHFPPDKCDARRMKCGKLAWPMLSHNSQLSDGKGQKLVRTDSLIIKNLKTNKVLQIYREIGKKPVLSFGNSSGDEAMHIYCLSNTEHRTEVFMLVADDDVRDHAHTRGAGN